MRRERKKNQQEQETCNITSFLQLVPLNLNIVFHQFPDAHFTISAVGEHFTRMAIIISGSQVTVIIAGAAYMFKVGNSSLYSSLFELRFAHCWFYM